MSIEKPLPNFPAALDDPSGDDGLGALETDQGRLPLVALDVRAMIDGLLCRTVVEQTFVNPTDTAVEATYIFPLPDRSGVTDFVMTVNDRVVRGKLDERGAAREAYDQAVEEGRRAAIAEEDRPGVFTLRVGNLMPGDRAVVRLTLAGALPYVDGEAVFRFPLVVAPRYVPGIPMPGPSAGDGVADDTDAAPDASRVTPPVLLKGFPNPVRLGISVELQGLEEGPEATGVRSSLHAVRAMTEAGVCRVSLQPGGGERLDRDFILRFRLGGEGVRTSLSFHPDAGATNAGTFALTVVPPAGRGAVARRPRDLAFVLDRSGSMEGWKVVAARRAIAGMVDSLGDADRFAVIVFDNHMIEPPGLEGSLVRASDRNRFRAVEFLGGVEAAGGTEMAAPLMLAAERLGAGEDGRDRVLVLVTDGQVANEDQVLGSLAPVLRGARVFSLGVDRAVNEGFLNRLAKLGGPGGGCELVESEERLDAVTESIENRIGSPLLTTIRVVPEGWDVEADTLVPERASSVFAGSPRLILGRYKGAPGRSRLTAEGADGEPWSVNLSPTTRENPAVAAAWARGQVRKLEDRYVVAHDGRESLEREVVATSLRFGVLCRFTAYVAVDESEVANPSGLLIRIVQPVSTPSGWENVRIGNQFQSPAGGAGRRQRVSDATRTPRSASAPPASHSPEISKRSFSRDISPPSFSTESLIAPRRGLGAIFGALGQAFGQGSASDVGPHSTKAYGPGGEWLPTRFRVKVPLANNSHRTVFRAFDKDLGRDVKVEVVKVGPTSPGGASAERFFSAMTDLASRIVSLKRPEVLGPIDVVKWSDNDAVLLVFEDVSGRALNEVTAGPDGVPPAVAAAIGLWVAEALAAAHRAGLVHGDLKPDRIVIKESGGGWVLGFGEIATRSEAGESLPWAVMGRPVHVAPEVLSGKARMKPPGDVYALGVVLYRMLTGAVPFDGNGSELLQEILRSRPTPPRSLNPAVPPALEAICLKAMAKQPNSRPTADELAGALRTYIGGGGATPKKAAFWK